MVGDAGNWHEFDRWEATHVFGLGSISIIGLTIDQEHLPRSHGAFDDGAEVGTVTSMGWGDSKYYREMADECARAGPPDHEPPQSN